MYISSSVTDYDHDSPCALVQKSGHIALKFQAAEYFLSKIVMEGDEFGREHIASKNIVIRVKNVNSDFELIRTNAQGMNLAKCLQQQYKN